jgi:peptidoglycan/xylan/chitin deacetylase (PgdA/CDA1 family)
MTLRQLITGLDQTDPEKALSGFFNHYGYDSYAFNDSLPLNWKEIEELSADELVTIGSHTINHHNLIQLPDSYSRDEIARSKEILESKIKKRVDHFSYPLGNYGPREIGYVKESGYKTSTIIKNANVFADHLKHLHTLPRFSINSITTDSVLTLHTSGFFPSVLNKFVRIVV